MPFLAGTEKRSTISLSELGSEGSQINVAVSEISKTLEQKLLLFFRSLVNPDHNPNYSALAKPGGLLLHDPEEGFYTEESQNYLPLNVLSYSCAWGTITQNIPRPQRENKLLTHFQLFTQPVNKFSPDQGLVIFPLASTSKQEKDFRTAFLNGFNLNRTPIVVQGVTMKSPMAVAIFHDILSQINLDREGFPAAKAKRFLDNTAHILPKDCHTQLSNLLNPVQFNLLINMLPKKINIENDRVEHSRDPHGRLQYKKLPNSQWVQSLTNITRGFSPEEKMALYTVISAYHKQFLFDDATSARLLSQPDDALFDAVVEYLSTEEIMPEQICAFLETGLDIKSAKDIAPHPIFAPLFSALDDDFDEESPIKEIAENILGYLPGQEKDTPAVVLSQFIAKHILPTLQSQLSDWYLMFHNSDIISTQHSKALQVVHYAITHTDRNILNPLDKESVAGPASINYCKRTQNKTSVSLKEEKIIDSISPVTAKLLFDIISLSSKEILTPAGRATLRGLRVDPSLFPVGVTMLQEGVALAFFRFQADLIPASLLLRSEQTIPTTNPVISKVSAFLVNSGIAIPNYLSTDLHKGTSAVYERIIFGDNGKNTYKALIQAYHHTAKEVVDTCQKNLSKLLPPSDVKALLTILAKLPADCIYNAIEHYIADELVRSRRETGKLSSNCIAIGKIQTVLKPIIQILSSPGASAHTTHQGGDSFWQSPDTHRFFHVAINKAMNKTKERLCDAADAPLLLISESKAASEAEDKISELWSQVPFAMRLCDTETKRDAIGGIIERLWAAGSKSLLSVLCLRLMASVPDCVIPEELRQILINKKHLLNEDRSISTRTKALIINVIPMPENVLALMMMKIKISYPRNFVIPKIYHEILHKAGLINDKGDPTPISVELLDKMIAFLPHKVIKREISPLDRGLDILLSKDIVFTAGWAGIRNYNFGLISALCAPHVLSLRAALSESCSKVPIELKKITHPYVQLIWDALTNPGALLDVSDAYNGAKKHITALGSIFESPEECTHKFWNDRLDLDTRAEEDDTPESALSSWFQPKALPTASIPTPDHVSLYGKVSPDKIARYLTPEDSPESNGIKRSLPF